MSMKALWQWGIVGLEKAFRAEPSHGSPPSPQGPLARAGVSIPGRTLEPWAVGMCECPGAPASPGIPWGLSAPAGHGTPVARASEGPQGLTAGTGLNTNERTEGEIFLTIVNFRSRK